MKPAFHTSVQKERERNRQLRKWGSLSAPLGEKERDRDGSGGFLGVRKNLGEILERETAVRVLTHKWNMSDLRSQKLTVVHTHIFNSNYHVKHSGSNKIANAHSSKFTLINKNIDPEGIERC